MRYKRGFTLAEILIVLMVIGFIATMTIPTLMGGVTESQLKTGYKKAFNSISSIASMAKSTGKLPSTSTAANAQDFLVTMNNNMAVKAYVANATSAINSGTVITPANYSTCLNVGASVIGETVGTCAASTTPTAAVGTGWLITEDNMAYTVTMGHATSGTKCGSKITVANQTTGSNAKNNSCVLVVVDVNGLTKGPNLFDSQVGSAANNMGGFNASNKMVTLTGDQYPIFIANNGATAGSETALVTGRIVGDAN